jgi:hypothetical protein
VSGRSRRVPEEDDDSEGSTGHHTKLVTPDAPSRKEIARLEDGRLIQLERQLSETLSAKTKRDQRIGQLTVELALKSALLAQGAEEKKRAGLELHELQAKHAELLLSRDRALEQAEANAAEVKRRAGLEQREMQAKLDGLLLSRDQAEANAAEEKKRAGLELRELQANLDESLLSRDLAEANVAEEKRRAGLERRELQAKLDGLLLSRGQAEANAAEEKKRTRLELRELQAKLDESLLSRDQAEANAAEEKKRAGLEQRELQAKLDESMLSRDELLRTLEQAQNTLQKTTPRSADADERSRPAWEQATELAKARAELAAVRLRLTDAEDGRVKLRAEADTLRAQAAAGLVNTVVDRAMHSLTERVRSMETEVSSLRGNEKSIEDMECRNEG